VVKLYIIKAHIPLRSLYSVSIVIKLVRTESEQAPDLHPAGKIIAVYNFGVIPSNDRANHSSPFLKPEFWHSGKITVLKHRHDCHLVLI
jgi:hypothetical protein